MKFSLLLFVASPFLARSAYAVADSGHENAKETRTPSHWEEGHARWFAAATLEAGLYMKPQIAVGYGKPNWSYVDVDAYPMTTTSFAAVYAGARAALPFANLRIGVRDTYSYSRSFLPPKATYDADDVTTVTRDHAHYMTGEAELTLTAPLWKGYAVASFTLYVADVPRGTYLYEESLRGVMRAPWILGNRVGYVFGFGADDWIKAGALGELVVLPGRGERIVRAGPAAVVTLTDHLQAMGTLSLVVASPDDLGIFNGPFGVLGLSYSWATGDPHPGFP